MLLRFELTFVVIKKTRIKVRRVGNREKCAQGTNMRRVLINHVIGFNIFILVFKNLRKIRKFKQES